MSERKCAKWCGRGCTRAEYEAAREAGKALARKLGSGWRPRVWENMGWHHAALSHDRMIDVMGSGREYSALLNGGSHVAYGRSPRSAVRALRSSVEQARAMVAGFDAAVRRWK